MSSYSSLQTANESDIDFSVFSVGSDLDLDFGFGGATKPVSTDAQALKRAGTGGRSPESLLVLTAKEVALHFPFEVVESSPLAVPEELQRLIAFHSFPTDEDDIWRYSCLSSGGSYEFDQGEALWADKAVKECVQIGFHLSATVLTSVHIAPTFVGVSSGDGNDLLGNATNASILPDPYHVNFHWNSSTDAHRQPGMADTSTTPNNNGLTDPANRTGFDIEPGYPAHRVSLTFDRGRITSCSCTCTYDTEDGCINVASSRDNPEDLVITQTASDMNQFRPGLVNGSGAFSYQPMNADPATTGRDRGATRVCNGPILFPGATPVSTIRRGNHVRSSFARSVARGLDINAPRQQQAQVPVRGDSETNLDLCWRNPSQDRMALTVGFSPPGTWCSHVVATCLMRIRQPGSILLRAPISESLSKLSKEDLQKFAQNLICYVGPKKILPAAQRILDQLLASTDNPMKSSIGAPDPTAGGAVGDAAAWCFDGAVLEEKLRVTLRRFWASKPSVIFSDIGSLHFNSPKDVEHFHRALHSLRGNEPRGVWDLLAIIGDMMRRQDNNGVLLLEIVTRCIIDMRELMSLWCFAQMKPYLLLKGLPRQTQYAALWLCEETVQLWRLACLNPDLRPQVGLVPGRVPSGSSAISACSNASGGNAISGCWLLQQLTRRLKAFHLFALEQAGYRITAVNTDSDHLSSESSPSMASGANGGSSEDFQRFIGFKPALAACCLNWPLDMPPTHAFSIAEFRSCMPTFLGARPTAPSEELLGTSYNSTISSYAKWMRTIRPLKHLRLDVDPVSLDLPDPPSAQLFADLPKPCNDVELAFARFQALDVHGHMEQSLVWARYLACHLLHTSRDFVADLETVAFDVVGSSQLPGCAGSSLFGSPADHESSVETGTDAVFSRPHDTVTRRQRRVVMGTPVSGLSVPHAGPEINGGSRGKKQNVTTVTPDGSSASADGIYSKAIIWASKVSNLLDQIRCLMECLTRGYNEFVFSSTNVTSANRITSNGRTLLTYRGPDPTFINFHLDDTASPVAQQTLRSNMLSIKDEWTCLDIELAFRLGFYGLTLPRPPTLSPTLEVRLFDQEVALVSRLCRLPLHLACPHVVQNIRHEASLLARGLSAYQTDILVPYNLLTYVFHQLVGVYPTSEVLSSFSNPDSLSGSRDPSENDTGISDFLATRNRSDISEGANPSEQEAGLAWTNGTSESDGISHCPVLSTGIILAGSGYPLAFSVHQGRRAGTDFHVRKCRSQVADMVALRDVILSDADLGFTAALSVIGTRSRVPQSTHPYFIEGQWAQLDALMVYLLRHYRDDIAKLDRLLIHLLDRFYNPHFKSPPLWACLSLPPRDLMRYDAADTNGDNACESSADTVANFINPVVNVPKSPNMPGVCASPDFSESRFVPALDTICSNIEPVHPVPITSKSTSVEELQLSSVDVNILTEERNDAFPALEEHDKAAPEIAPTELNLDAEGLILGSHVEPPVSLSRPSSPEKCSIVNKPRTNEPLSASEDTDTLSDSKRWSAAFRCATLGDPLKRGRHSVGMAAVDTSAPETTSSDNSPAACRRLFLCERRETNRLTGVQDVHSNLPGDLLQSSSSIPNTNTTPTPGIEVRKMRSKLPDVSVPSFIRTSRRRVGHMMRSSLSSFSSFSEDDDPIPARVDYTADEGQSLESIPAGFPLAQSEVAREQVSYVGGPIRVTYPVDPSNSECVVCVG
ncbi:hypothetical protein P879_10317 [Paragonimus westermani]|uniref:ZSWIM8 TPR repeats domain-containing protein n=1 Tax=Paragonimus westermani TaxID=34504 RepID=A0A8T0D6N4_9TREM|nr:hypothetical protein P879_10317 [Paragonimus westermani]